MSDPDANQTMIERVAEALRALERKRNVGYDALARAAIEAMREPTPRMCDMGEGYNLRCGCPRCDHENWEKVAEGWRAMIDAALAA